jgi:hypothetical protein
MGMLAFMTLAAVNVSAQDGTATGTFTVKGKAVKLTYAYAKSEPDFFDKAKRQVRLIVSDVKLTPAQLDGPFALQELVDADKAHAITATVNATGQVTGVQLYDKGFNMSSVSTAGTNNKFEGSVTATEIDGKLFTVAPATFDKVTYAFTATVKAPIQGGAAAAGASKAGPRTAEQEAVLKAAQTYMKAARAGDVAGLKAAVTADAAPDLDGPNGKDIVGMLKAMVPQNPTVGPIEITGDTAKVTFEEKTKDSSSTSSVKLKKVKGVWKVDPKG